MKVIAVLGMFLATMALLSYATDRDEEWVFEMIMILK